MKGNPAASEISGISSAAGLPGDEFLLGLHTWGSDLPILVNGGSVPHAIERQGIAFLFALHFDQVSCRAILNQFEYGSKFHLPFLMLERFDTLGDEYRQSRLADLAGCCHKLFVVVVVCQPGLILIAEHCIGYPVGPMPANVIGGTECLQMLALERGAHVSLWLGLYMAQAQHQRCGQNDWIFHGVFVLPIYGGRRFM